MISVVAGDSFWAIGWGQTSENKQSKNEPSTCFLHSNVIFYYFISISYSISNIFNASSNSYTEC
jgi:hypothetical protein